VLGDPEANGEKAIDEPALQEIAEITGGRFFRASDKQALSDISAALNLLEPAKYSVHYFYPSTDLYYYFLALALIFFQSPAVVAVMRRKWAS
jgi:Ca-activated chloride channel family protein